MKIPAISVFAGVALYLSAAVTAHHGDAGRYADELTDITGTVVAIQLINPHALIVVAVTDAQGKTVHWQGELNNPRQLVQQGVVNDVKPGVKVTLSGRRLKSGAPYMNLTSRGRIVLTDSGKVVLQSADYEEAASKSPPR